MSYTEHIKGKMREIPIIKSYEETCKNIYEAETGSDKLPSWCMGYDEYLYEECPEYLLLKGRIFKIIEKEDIDPDTDFTNLTENEDGTISFETRFYNGGTCLSEVLESGIKRNGL